MVPPFLGSTEPITWSILSLLPFFERNVQSVGQIGSLGAFRNGHRCSPEEFLFDVVSGTARVLHECSPDRRGIWCAQPKFFDERSNPKISSANSACVTIRYCAGPSGFWSPCPASFFIETAPMHSSICAPQGFSGLKECFQLWRETLAKRTIAKVFAPPALASDPHTPRQISVAQ